MNHPLKEHYQLLLCYVCFVVQHLDFLTDIERDTFKTAFEVDQAWMVQHAADRQPFICQSQSLNLFYDPAEEGAGRRMHNDLMRAWHGGVKTVYYCRSVEHKKAERVSKQAESNKMTDYKTVSDNYSSCLGCES